MTFEIDEPEAIKTLALLGGIKAGDKVQYGFECGNNHIRGKWGTVICVFKTPEFRDGQIFRMDVDVDGASIESTGLYFIKWRRQPEKT